ncbi:MAG: DUF4960 domain-containing protein [Muribaculaceae bacterium]|nr:DUF4960 domain-containing protein [Muribaculaceae bacterium]
MRKLTRKMMLGSTLLLTGVLPALAGNVTNIRFAGNAMKDLVKGQAFNIEGRFQTMEINGASGAAWRTDGYSSKSAGQLARVVDGNSMSATLRFAIDTYPIIGHENGTTDKVDLAGCLDEGGKKGFAFQINRLGQYGVLIYVGNSLVEVNANDKVPLWEWTELTVAYDGNTVKLFRNGKEVGSKAASGNVTVGGSELHFAIGNRHADLGGAEICGINGAYETLIIDDPATVPAFTPTYANLDIPASRYENDRFRARFHGQPGQNWSNETHGLYYNPNDKKYHAFYQKTGSAPIMSHQHWGHIISDDLITWHDEKPALAPSEFYDIKGCWSGCVFSDPILNGGNPTIIYTGVDFAKPYVATAFCDDPQNMRDWHKDTKNPIAALTETPVGDGRDTYFYRDGNDAYFMVGARDAVHYYKWNGSGWSYKGEFYHTEDGVDNGHNTEMPNVTNMGGGKWLMTTSPLAGRYGTTCLYRVGSLNDGKFVNYSGAEKVDLFGCDGYGLLSPSVTKTPDGRIVALGIVPDKMPTQVNIDLGYAHLYSLPRQWSLDANGRLLQQPAKEIYAHRDLSSKFTLANQDLDGYVSLENVRGRAAEVTATFVVGDSPFGFTFYKNAKGKGGSLTYNPANGELVFDMKDLPRLQDDGNKNRFSALLPVRPGKGENFKIQMFIDHSVIDIFVNDRYASTVRVYPTDDASDLIEVFAQGLTKLASLEAYLLGKGGDTFGEPIVPPALRKPEKLETTGRVALYVGYDNLDQLIKDDKNPATHEEKAVYDYFVSKFPTGTVLFAGDVDKIKAEDFDCLWVTCDRPGIAQGWESLPEAFSNANFVNALKNYSVAGGNLYLTKFAGQLVVAIGRTNDAPNVFNSGEGGDKDDEWSMQAMPYSDYIDSPIFNNLPLRDDGYAKVLPLMSGSHHRDDHNCLWNLNDFGGADNFMARNNAEVLGTWGHDGGQVGAGLVEFHPQVSRGTRATDPEDVKERKGTIIVNGLAAYEWAQTGGANESHQNILDLTTNIMMYLSPVAEGGTGVQPGEDPKEPENPENPENPSEDPENPGGDDPVVTPSKPETLESTGKVAFYVGYDSLEEAFNNVEAKATYEYFTKAFPKGSVIFPQDVDMISTDNFDVIWVNCDRRNVEEGWEHLPDAFKNEAFVEALKNYNLAGGNLYLSTFATQLTVAIGRISNDFRPMVFYSGAGEDKNDVWAMNIAPYGKDWSTSHLIFTDLPVVDAGFGKTVSLMSGVNHREDHNCLWDLNNYGGYENFTASTNSEVLGTWGHDGGQNGAGLIEFYPVNNTRAADPEKIESRKGTIIVNGLAACEWDPVTGSNDSQANIEKLTTNILTYLSPVAEGSSVGEDPEKPGTDPEKPGEDPVVPPFEETLESTGRIALYVGYADLDALKEEDKDQNTHEEKAVYDYFVANFPEGTVLFAGDAAEINAEDFDCVWITCDRPGIAQGWENLPYEYNNPELIDVLKEYSNAGGNLYLSKFASQLVNAIGRTDDAPDVFYSGEGSMKDDVWSMNVMHHGNDWSTHLLFSGLPIEDKGYGKVLSLMSGTHHRDDHNCLWDVNNFGNGEDFMAKNNARILGTWGHEGGENGAGLIEFLPLTTRAAESDAIAQRKGTIIVNGLAAYEWAQTGGANESHANIESLTGNILKYLSPVDVNAKDPGTEPGGEDNPTGIESLDADGDNGIEWYNLQGLKVAEPTKGIYLMKKNGKFIKIIR